MKRLALFALVVLAGCAKPPAEIKPMSEYNLDELVGQGLKSAPGGVLLTKPLLLEPEKRLEAAFRSSHYAIETGTLRNPGVQVVLVRSFSDGSALSDEDRKSIAQLARENKATVVENMKVESKVGPDGKTPMVMPSPKGLFAAREAYSPVQTRIVFDTESDAKKAAKYIDSPYRIKIEKYLTVWYVNATIDMTAELKDEEKEPFEALAKRFNGRLDGVYTVFVGERP